MTLPEHWTTDRTFVKNVHAGDVETLTSLFNSNSDIAELDPTFAPTDSNEVRALIEESVSSASEGRGFRMQAIRLRDSRTLIGYFHLREAKPRLDIVGMTIFFITPEYRSSGFGREVVDGLIGQLTADTVNNFVWARVFLKNIPALRFWTARGFTRIVEHNGEHIHVDGNHASVILEHIIERTDRSKFPQR